MLNENHGNAQIQINLPYRRKKFSCGNGVKLGSGFVQHQYLWLHSHNRSQIQKLLLPAGQFFHILVEPVLNPKKAGHFRHPKAYGLLVIS